MAKDHGRWRYAEVKIERGSELETKILADVAQFQQLGLQLKDVLILRLAEAYGIGHLPSTVEAPRLISSSREEPSTSSHGETKKEDEDEGFMRFDEFLKGPR